MRQCNLRPRDGSFDSAQVFQLMKRPSDAMTDLTRAIELAEGTGNTLVARQAYTQRGSKTQRPNDRH